MLVPILLWLAVATTPFEDTQRRFHLNLPAGWQFTPQPGDIGGATFRRAADGVFVNGMVRVVNFDRELPLDQFVARISAVSSGEPGYRQLATERCEVAGHPGWRRRFLTLVNGDPHLPKMVEQRLLVWNNVGYVVHAETLADAFPRFESDVAALMHSFAVGALADVATSPSHVAPHRVVGQWRSEDRRHRLELSAGGSITLDNAHGTYYVDQGSLVAELDGNKQIFGLDFDAGRLVLSGHAFASGERFVAVSAPTQGGHAAGDEAKRRPRRRLDTRVTRPAALPTPVHHPGKTASP